MDATREQEHSAFCRALLLPAVAVEVAASALGSRMGSRDGESAGIAAPLPVGTMRTQANVPVCLKSRVRSIFLHHLCLKAAWRLMQLCIAALAGRCWALGGLHPRTYSGALTRTRRRRSFFAARQHDLEKVRFPRKIQLLSLPHPVFHLVITPEVVAAAARPLGWKGEAGDHG